MHRNVSTCNKTSDANQRFPSQHVPRIARRLLECRRNCSRNRNLKEFALPEKSTPEPVDSVDPAHDIKVTFQANPQKHQHVPLRNVRRMSVRPGKYQRRSSDFPRKNMAANSDGKPNLGVTDDGQSESKHLSLMDSGRTIRMDQRRLIVVDQPDTGPSRSILSSISDRSYALGSVDREGTNDTAEKGYPVLSFQYIEPHTIELLVVVTERMTQRFGRLINEYLLSLLTTVSSLLRHPSLKTSLQLKIVDIMQLDRNYAIRHNLDDWSYSKQEQVMSRFCRWVNRLRRPDFNWDSAILLNIGLGAKHDFEQNSDCEMEDQNHGNEFMDNTSHMLTSDTGISVDDLSQSQHYWQPRESPDVVRRDTIMSGTLYFDNFPLRWSACSRQAIHSFLETNGASCLRREDMPSALHAADWLAKRSRDDLPGSMFSLDQQCQFVLKVHATRFCGQLLPVCRQLYCQDAENGACLPMEAAWAEGSSCGENKPCDKQSNIRQELCDAIGHQYGSQLGAYMPKLGEANACSLTCLDRGQAVHHAISLPDGTPCYSQRDDICIKGRCWETGCDGVLGSSQRFDQCRVCGGDNSSCVEIRGVYNGESVNSLGIQTRGLINAVRIPRGVTNAFVRKVSPRTTPYSSDSYDDYMLRKLDFCKTHMSTIMTVVFQRLYL
ncbi:unnamed protein product [Echinostoma caproni]|uniref:ADAM_CR_2 domain-containing protein n=1 Tax=Echinostoma caproni TaxID=27848 RepID=A0A183AH00_9TREM|nr:unnamed protein product [Echinostoma caproni]